MTVFMVARAAAVRPPAPVLLARTRAWEGDDAVARGDVAACESSSAPSLGTLGVSWQAL